MEFILKLINKMVIITLRGVNISFPFEPYGVQKEYMEKVIECLQDEKNGVLESPTGTGKTLSLLCASLAWLTMHKAKCKAERRKNAKCSKQHQMQNATNNTTDIPTIIYASRTHSQLTQAMQELKRTSYSDVWATIIGSRDQLCIHQKVMKQIGHINKTRMCKTLVKNRNCHLRSRVEKMVDESSVQELRIADIEDLVKLGQEHSFCPFYMAKEFRKTADIVFLPYNYLLDPKARRANKLNFKNCVIILDEAHNVERVCEESASFQLKTSDIALCVDELTNIMKHLESSGDLIGDDGENFFTTDEIALLKRMLLNLDKVIDNIPIINPDEGITYEGDYIFEVLGEAGIDGTSQLKIVELIKSLLKFMGNRDSPFQRLGDGLQVLLDLLLIVFQKTSTDYKEKVNQCFKVHFSRESGKTANTKVLSYWCFSPSFGMQMLMEQGVRCVILTSGTLAPLKPLISELGIDIRVRLENPHVITSQQICVRIVAAGPDKVALNSGFHNRDNMKYINSLGMTIINISRQIPNGLLIFFSSYSLLAKCQRCWVKSGNWIRLNELKQIFVEPKAKDPFNIVMRDFYKRVNDPAYAGAIFMAVCRGKVSEGLDFADVNGRAVIVTGLPYAPCMDRRIILKKKYLDDCRARNPNYMSGHDWYGLEATRAVNQAIGRVIRHQHDYGLILLLDERFNYDSIREQLSLWIRGNVRLAQNFGEVIRDVKQFFKNAVKFDILRDQQRAKCTKIATNVVSGEKNANDPNTENNVVNDSNIIIDPYIDNIVDIDSNDSNNNANIENEYGSVKIYELNKPKKTMKNDDDINIIDLTSDDEVPEKKQRLTSLNTNKNVREKKHDH